MACRDPGTVQNRVERGLRIKALGDAVYRPMHQGLGSVGLDSHPERTAVFERLAKSYIFDGADKHAICGHNARVRTCILVPLKANADILRRLHLRLVNSKPPRSGRSLSRSMNLYHPKTIH